MRINDVLARTVAVFFMVLAGWFGGLMTGVVSLGWLVRWLGTPKLQPPWDKIAFFGPAVMAAAAYFLFAITRPNEANR